MKLIKKVNYNKYERKRTDKIHFGNKNESYFEDEMDYGKMPKYKFSELSELEKIYWKHQNEKQRAKNR